MAKKKKRKIFLKKRYRFPLLILLILLIARILLPFFLERYVNKTLNSIPGYTGHVEDIDVALYRGAYVIEGLILQKENAKTSTPLLDFPENDISIEWKSLLDGRIVSEVEMYNPKFNYVFETQKKETPEGKPDTDDWTRALKDLVPIQINHLRVHNGRTNFVQLSADPNIDMFFKNIELQATNLSNVVNKEKALPSHLNATAISMGDGNVSLKGNMNLLKEIPDMDINFSLEKADVTALNSITRKYAGVDFQKGTFELYTEFAIANGYLEGYLKPMFINTTLIGKEDQGFFEKLWEGFVGVLKFVFKNQGTDTLATKAPLEGDLNQVESELIPTILNIFKNAWIKAFSEDVDKNINYRDAVEESKNPEE